MRYELQLFDYIVSNYINPVNKGSCLSKSEFDQWQIDLDKELERIQQALMMLVFSDHKDKIIERQIQLYQNKLILLSNEISQLIGHHHVEGQAEIEGNDLTKNLSIHTLKCIMRLLTFIEKHFKDYFNQDNTIPAAYFLSFQATLQHKLLKFKEIGANKNLDPNLVSIIKDHIKTYLNSPKDSTYRQLIYCKTFIDEIYLVVSSQVTGLKLEKQIINILIYLNFNALDMYQYLAIRIKKQYQSKSNYHEQLLTLKLFKKLINQSQIKPGFAFKQGTQTLKEGLGLWIEEELHYFKERKQLAIHFENRIKINQYHQKNHNKIYSALSVAQLAYLMKLMAKSNIIAPQDTGKLVDFICENFSTETQRDISKKSLRNKIYSPENTTIENVQEIMETLVEKAEKDKSLN
ncbi:hypothetical protein MATR_11710 [Marivirga tractuosa]|uniref:Uncharacterized protein n=1 Tax=Marivirga tractuosa (strain ATCC 23168 / DSM 4126 / NBRC 15989 / NCIMB 1408 / VKM B-1430 / H-43) TaxID=643867 RepID=E4TKN5_MARTH|nr:hypothetical protein Ftrac_1207 [Marivirga tractuosa DSM 4126]BDD14346.1 hypothetical protein MATR_11710 [Marivirga tractuosa]